MIYGLVKGDSPFMIMTKGGYFVRALIQDYEYLRITPYQIKDQNRNFSDVTSIGKSSRLLNKVAGSLLGLQINI
jgi:hypothetical protein